MAQVPRRVTSESYNASRTRSSRVQVQGVWRRLPPSGSNPDLLPRTLSPERRIRRECSAPLLALIAVVHDPAVVAPWKRHDLIPTDAFSAIARAQSSGSRRAPVH